MTKLPRVLTIDGPSGSGKGTIGWNISRELGWDFLDSGAIYRLLGLSAHQRGVDLADEVALVALAQQLDIRFAAVDGADHFITLLDNQDVTAEIRTEECGRYASKVASLPLVRQALLARQRAFRQVPGLVADGRDMGTVVFPDADVKVFMTASAKVRAERRFNQLKQKGIDANLGQILADIEERDARDTSRAVSPLVPAVDAVVIDTSALGIEEVTRQVLALIR
ncbi:MAG: (d)CMP kinase [Gammaproteobacteria bacterium]|nr:(d)CMP kinase [Gammaproteobacteria bacterium]